MRKSTSPPNLPKLRQNHGLSMPAAPGDWGPPGNLRALAEALAVEAEGMRLREIKSVPHVWGHAILFESALLNESHPAHKDAVGHWRALLAMLALRKFDPSYSLICRALKLDRAASGKRAEQAFAHVAGRETLDPKICPNSDWYLLYRSLGAEEKGEQEVLVGMLSPSTIVAPARNFAAEDFFGNDDLGGQYWASAKHGLRDPLAGEGKLSYDEIWVCQLYVANLSTAVKDQDLETKRESDRETRRESDDSEAAKAKSAYLYGIASRLKQFHDDLKREGEGRHFVEWKKDDDQDLVTDDDDVVPRVYRAVNAVWKEADRADAIVTDLKLGELVLDSGKTITLVLADWRCADSLERLPKRVSLFSKRTLADLPRPTPDGAPGPIPSYLREEAADQDILLLSPNDLLSDCLTDLKEFQTSHHPKQYSTKLLPIKPAALLLFPQITGDLEALVSKHLVLRGSKSEPRVALEVTLTSTLNQSEGKEEKRKHQVSRKYRAGTTSKREEAYAPGALAAWPNFQMTSSDSSWKWNYLFTMTNVSSSPEDRSVVATSGISRSILLRDLRQLGHVKDLKARLGRWSSDQGRWTELSGIEVQGNDDPWFEWLRMCSRTGQDPTEKSLQRSDTAFEAALFRLPSPDGDSVYAGLGILPPSPTLSTQDAEAGGGAQIACDFGTSNTIVYYKRAGRKSEPLDFQPRLRRFNHYQKDGATVEWDREYSKFMPTESVNQPFSTVLEIRSADGVADLVKEWRNAKEPALWRDHAFFDPDVLNLTESLLLSKEGGANLVFDLKWNTKQEARERMGRYLRHITMLSLAEVSARDGQAPSDVSWHFSYPISMHEPDDYRNVIKLEALNNSERKNDVVFHTESQATFNYFKGMDETDPTAMLVLDIGGGSTDILLWRRGSEHGTMVWQHSLRLAGDHLMTEFLVHNREFLDGLGIAAIGRGGGHGVFGDEESLDKFMNPPTDQPPGTVDRNVARAIINSPLFGSAFEKKWFTMRKTKAPLRLQAGAWAMMGGLIWFLGLQTEALLNRKRSALVREDLKTMKLCFGGRGSTLFKLLSQNNEAFKAMTLRVTEHASAVKSYFSKDMKHEAAKGMLAESLARLESGGADLCVLGVGATLGTDASVDANTFIHDVKASLALAANENAQRTDRYPAVAVEEFVAVVEEAARLGGLQITFKPEAMQTIAIAGKEAIAKLLRLGDEPPYIAMLRKTLSLIYEGKSIEVDWQAQRT